MKRLITFAAATMFAVGAHAAPPSTESIEKLMAVTHVEKMQEAMRPQVQAMMKAMMDQAMKGQTVTAEQQKILDQFIAKAAAITSEETDFSKMKPMFIEIYGANLTQEDVDGLIAFYQTPTGQVVINKMPLIMQAIMKEMPKRMIPMLQKVQAAAQEMQEQLEALKKK